MAGTAMRIVIASAVPRDPDQGAAGTLCATIDTLRELGHEVYEVWAKDLGSCWVRHGNLYYLLELPFRYRNAIRRWKKRLAFDVVQVSQPHAWLAAREHRQRRSPGIFVNRSHGWEEHVYQVMQRWKLESAETPRARWRQVASLRMRRTTQLS